MIATLGRYGDLRARSVTDVLLPSALEFGSRRETLSGILAALAGGYTAGRLAGAPKESTAGWRGLTTWALTTLVIYEVCGISLGKVRARDLRVRGRRAALIGLSRHDSSTPIASATGGHDGGA